MQISFFFWSAVRQNSFLFKDIAEATMFNQHGNT